LRASDVAFGSDVHCVNDVTPDGAVGKYHITASICEQHHYAKHNITFALAKISQTGKRADIQDFSSCVFALSVCNKGLGIAHFHLTSQMRCSPLAVLLNSPIRTSPIMGTVFFLS
jgi:hypothetical protein